MNKLATANFLKKIDSKLDQLIVYNHTIYSD